MILIGGTSLRIEELPYSDVLDYQIEPKQSTLVIKLKTGAKRADCLAVYLSEEIAKTIEFPKDFPEFELIADKTFYFKDDRHLLDLLDQGNNSESDVVEDGVTEEPQESEVEFGDHQQSPDSHSESSSSEDTLEEADLSLQDQFLTIPNSDEDTDSLRQQLMVANQTITQLRANLEDRDSSIEEVYRIQEIQLLEMRDSYEKRVDEANSVIDELRQRVNKSDVPDEHKNFVKFATYANNYKAALREGFTDEERSSLVNTKSKLFIFASGSGDSIHSMMKNVHHLLQGNKELVVADFSNDYFLLAKYRIQSRDTSILLDKDEVSMDQLVRDANVSKLIPTAFYNDIALLQVDWVTVLNRLASYAQGKPIILLFNSITSFSVRYTVSKLSTVGSLFIFAKSNPLVLATLTGDIAFIPSERFRIVTLDYIDVVKSMLETIGSKHNVIAFKEAVNWDKLGVTK